MRKKTLKIKFFLLFCSLAGYSTIISAQDKTVKEKNEKDSTIISIPYGSKLKTEFSGASDVISGKYWRMCLYSIYPMHCQEEYRG